MVPLFFLSLSTLIILKYILYNIFFFLNYLNFLLFTLANIPINLAPAYLETDGYDDSVRCITN